MLRQLIICVCTFGVILLSLSTGGARAQTSGGQGLLKDPVGSFVFDASLGNPAPPITVWYYRPDKVGNGTRVVFLMHGSSRTAQEARDMGALNGKVLSESVWAFAAIEDIFDRVRQELQLNAATYDILGHSAGGQLVHRLVL